MEFFLSYFVATRGVARSRVVIVLAQAQKGPGSDDSRDAVE